jgi:hypothetical protein
MTPPAGRLTCTSSFLSSRFLSLTAAWGRPCERGRSTYNNGVVRWRRGVQGRIPRNRGFREGIGHHGAHARARPTALTGLANSLRRLLILFLSDAPPLLPSSSSENKDFAFGKAAGGGRCCLRAWRLSASMAPEWTTDSNSRPLKERGGARALRPLVRCEKWGAGRIFRAHCSRITFRLSPSLAQPRQPPIRHR